MTSRRRFLAALPGTLLAVPAAAQRLSGAVRELSGQVTLDDRPVTRETALGAGQTLRTGADGRIWFMFGADAYFLRPNSALRFGVSSPHEPIVDLLRLVAGALGGTFARGMRRLLVTPGATIGIRGTGVYLEATEELTYACTCFGTTEIGATMVTARNHSARRIVRDGRILDAPFERHTSEEITRLEALAGRGDPFRK